MNKHITFAFIKPSDRYVMSKCKMCGYIVKIQSVDGEPLKDYRLPSKCPCCGWRMEDVSEE